MPKTLTKDANAQIIGGAFAHRENADKALADFRALGVPEQNIQVVVQVNEKMPDTAYTDILTDRGMTQAQANYYDKAVRNGRTLIVIQGVVDPAPIIDIFDRNKAEYNPDGSRNAREDVSGMTAGAVIGAVAGGVAGSVVGGPVGTLAGGAAGAIVGGGLGAAAGKAAEHHK